MKPSLVAFAAALLCSCGVPETEHNAVVAERDSLRELLTAYRTESGVSDPDVPAGQSRLVAEYAQLLDIEVTSARYIDTYTRGRLPGIRFRIKNEGSRPVETLMVTAYYKDADSAVVGEQDFLLVSNAGFDPTGVLRPNYSMRIPGDPDRYLTAEQITDEWEPGNVEVKVKDIVFEDQ